MQKLGLFCLKRKAFVLQRLERVGKIRAALYRKSDKLGHLRAKTVVDAVNLGYLRINLLLPEIMLGDIVCVCVTYPLSGARQNFSVQCHCLTVFNLFVY